MKDAAANRYRLRHALFIDVSGGGTLATRPCVS